MITQDNYILSGRRSLTQKLRSQHPLLRFFIAFGFLTGLSVVVLLGIFIFKFQAFSSDVKVFIPRSFILGTIMIVLSAFCCHSLRVTFMRQQLKAASLFYGLTIACGLFFCFLVLVGWREMAFLDHQFALDRWNASMIVASISLVLGLAVITACVVSLVLCIRFMRKSFSLVGQLIISTNPFENKRIKKLTTFWYFLSLNWLLAFFVFTMAKIY